MEESKEKKWTLWLLRFSSVLFAFTYPLVFDWPIVSLLAADCTSITALGYYSIVIPSFSMPVFMVIGVWKMWENYVHKNYKKARRYTTISLLAFALILLLVIFLESFKR